MDYQKIIEKIYKKIKKSKNTGKNYDGIPELKKVNPNLFAISLFTVNGESFNIGDYDKLFAIESISKVFSLAKALEIVGEPKLKKLIGTSQTGMPFNSIIDIENTPNHTINSFENGGAMATTSLCYDKNKNKFKNKIFDMMSDFAGRKLTYSKEIYNSEIANSDRNRAIAYLLKSYGRFYGDIDSTLEVYTKHCSAMVTSKDIAIMGATIANNGINPKTGKNVINKKFIPYIIAHMISNGLYEYSETFFSDVGLPAKSGIGGGILLVVPGVMGIGIVSPPLNEHGNSSKGVLTAYELSKFLKFNLFT